MLCSVSVLLIIVLRVMVLLVMVLLIMVLHVVVLLVVAGGRRAAGHLNMYLAEANIGKVK